MKPIQVPKYPLNEVVYSFTGQRFRVRKIRLNTTAGQFEYELDGVDENIGATMLEDGLQSEAHYHAMRAEDEAEDRYLEGGK